MSAHILSRGHGHVLCKRTVVNAARRDVPVCLTIAGSDSGGGAGIQADLKAFAAAGVHGASAITAITAQNTVAVTAIETVSPAMIVAQVRAVAEDIGIDAVKLGMLAGGETIGAVLEALDLLDPGTPVVVDPVLVAESGARLLDRGAEDALRTRVLPRATVATPNVPEARALTGGRTRLEGADLARAVLALGPRAVVLTGGHREDATDIFCDADQTVEIPGERFADGAAHGSGCTHAATLAARLALGDSPLEAARAAKAATSRRDSRRAARSAPAPARST